MKKMLTVLLAGMLLLAFAGVASADHPVWTGDQPNYKFSVGGQIEIDGFLQDSFPAFPDDDNKYYNQETRIFFKGNWGDVEGLVRLEWDYDWEQGNQNKGETTNNALDLAWIKFPVPGTPVKISAGLQPLIFGSSILLDDSFYILSATAAMGDMGFTLGTLKLDETYLADDDVDGYYALFTGKAAGADLQAIWYTERSEDSDYAPWDLGLYLKGSAAALKYWVEGHYQGGTIDADLDLQAYAVAGGVTATVGMADVTLWGGFGSGDGDDDDKVEQFAPVSPYFKPDLIVIDNLNGSSIGNVWVVAVKAAAKPMANLSVWAQAGYYNRVEEVVPDETVIGTEFDLGAVLKINDQLSWKVTFGYLASGDGLAVGYDENPFEVNNEFMVSF